MSQAGRFLWVMFVAWLTYRMFTVDWDIGFGETDPATIIFIAVVLLLLPYTNWQKYLAPPNQQTRRTGPYRRDNQRQSRDDHREQGRDSGFEETTYAYDEPEDNSQRSRNR